MIAAVRSDVGQRKGNEDSFYVPGQIEGLYIVADGMGGHNAGEVASQLAVSFIVAQIMLNRHLPAHERLRSAVQKANTQIYNRACSRTNMSGMGTTLTMACVEGARLTIAHVGDSRAYLLHEDKLFRLTHDHSLMEELLRAGQITPQQAENHPHRHVITRALGTGPTVQVDLVEHDFGERDTLLLCSDGLTEHVTHEEIQQVLCRPDAPEALVDILLSMALDRGGQDNITIIVARGEGGE